MKLEVYKYINIPEVVEVINDSHDVVKELMLNEFNINKELVMVAHDNTTIVFMDKETLNDVFNEYKKEKPFETNLEWLEFQENHTEEINLRVLKLLGLRDDLRYFEELSSYMWELYN